MIGKFRLAHRRIYFSVEYDSTENIEEMLLTGAIDFGFLVNFSNRDQFYCHEVRVNEHTLVVAKSYLETFGSISSFKQLLEADLIDFNADFLCIKSWLKKNRPELLGQLRHCIPAVIAPTHRTSKELILAGAGIGVLPADIISAELKSGALVEVIKSAKRLRVGLDVAHQRKKTLRYCEELFLTFVKDGSN